MQSARLRITELNPHLLCALCGGYLVDATTIVECLHSFCKTCIVRYLESSKYCPICEVLVHKTRPLQNIRLDHTLQDIVYKLVPNLFRDEMKRRRNYYQVEDSVETQGSYSHNGDDTTYQRRRIIYFPDELFSVSLEFCPNGRIQPINKQKNGKKKKEELNKETRDVRYIQCKAAITVGYLKKFLRLKFSLQEIYQVDLFHEQGNLRDVYSLMDVAYIYSWKRKGVMKLYYSIYEKPEVKKEVTVGEGSCIKSESQVDQKIDGSSSCYSPHIMFSSNNCCNARLPHDLSPLELIATVAANDLGFTDERRGLKRKADSCDIYNENDDDSNGSIQIKKTIEHAIDLCSKSNNDNGTKCDRNEDKYECKTKQKIPNLPISRLVEKCASGSGFIPPDVNTNQRNQQSLQSADWHLHSHSMPEGIKGQSEERPNQTNPNHPATLSVYDYTEEPINYSNKRSSNHFTSNSPTKTNSLSGSDCSKINSGIGSSSPQKHKMEPSSDHGKSHKETSDSRQVTSLYNGHATPTEHNHQSPNKLSKESNH